MDEVANSWYHHQLTYLTPSGRDGVACLEGERDPAAAKKRGDTPEGMPPLFSVCVLCAQDACEVGLSCGCDEELRPDLTRRVDAFSQDEDSSVDCILHGNDLALAVAECEVVVEEPSTELVGSHVLVGFRQDLAEGAGCEVSF